MLLRLSGATPQHKSLGVSATHPALSPVELHGPSSLRGGAGTSQRPVHPIQTSSHAVAGKTRQEHISSRLFLTTPHLPKAHPNQSKCFAL